MSILSLVVVLLSIILSFWIMNRTSGAPPFNHMIPARPTSLFRRPLNLNPLPDVPVALVTGAGGFLGSNIAEQLVSKGWTVRGMIRPGQNPDGLMAMGASVVYGDLSDIDSLRAAMGNDTDVVFHVAALVGLWNGAAQRMLDVNVLGTRNVVDACLAQGVLRLVHTSSIGVYQGPGDQLEGAAFDESSPHFGLGHWMAYSYTKALAEEEVRGGIEDGLWATILNPGGIVGRYDVGGVIRSARLLARGQLPAVPHSSSPFGDATAIADAHIAAAVNGRVGRNYNLCGISVTLQRLIELCGEILEIDGHKPVVPSAFLMMYALAMEPFAWWTQTEPDLSFDLVMHMASETKGCSSERAQQELSYLPLKTEEDLRRSLASSIAWAKQNNHL